MKYFSILILIFTCHAQGESWRGDYSYISYGLAENWKKALSMSQKGDDWISFKNEETNATITFGVGPTVEYEGDTKSRILDRLKKEQQPKVLFEVILEPFGDSTTNKVDSEMDLFGRRWRAVNFEFESKKFGEMDVKVSAAFEGNCSWSIVIGIPKSYKSEQLDKSIAELLSSMAYTCPNKGVNFDSAEKTPLKLH